MLFISLIYFDIFNRWVASIDFGKIVGPIFKIWPVYKVIQKIKFGQKLHVPCIADILDLLYC